MKKHIPDLIAVLAFVIISLVYFFPAVMEGRILFQHDASAGVGAGQEGKEYFERTGERTRWTNSIFGGMPNYQLAPSYDSTSTLREAEKAYRLFLPNYVWLTFVMMLGFYILLRTLKINPALSAAGAIAWAFSSYFFILIANGHLWKYIALAYIPPTIAGIVLAYRGKYLIGGIVAALFVALQIQANHVQMSYYFFFVILGFAIAYFFQLKKEGNLSRFWKASGLLLAAAAIGIAINASTLYHTYTYGKHTMRGKSELVHQGDKAKQTSSGLDRDYITQWSYGIGETFTLLIPNAKGGVSDPLAYNRKAMEKANPMYRGLYSQLTQYWGTQPMTRGPVYVGALIMMLFVLGCFIVKGPLKWALLSLTVLSILLSWGRNFMPLTDFFIDWIPMYSSFRAVSSILVIAEFTIPLLAILALKEVVQNPRCIWSQWRKPAIISFALTGGLALLFALFPRVFFSGYISPMEMSALRNALEPQQLGGVIDNLETVRVSIFTADAWRSFFIILLGSGLILLYARKSFKPLYLILGVGAICLVDLWQVDKRYLHDDLFEPESVAVTTFRQTKTDEIILQDPDINYRVIDLSVSTFNDNKAAYWHKSVGGYHPAKLRRYQEMIEHYIAPEIQPAMKAIAQAGGDMEQVGPNDFPVLNMLNTKYIIMPISQTETVPIQNPYAFGNAWFVKNVQYVDNANQEIAAIAQANLRETAIVDKRFAEALGGVTQTQTDSLATIVQQSYEPNHLVFKSNSATDGIAVFSEIYYPDWEVTIDGNPVELGRANYILRALAVPAGEHVIEMRFDPQSVHVTETIAYIALAVLLLAVASVIIGWFRSKQKTNVSTGE